MNTAHLINNQTNPDEHYTRRCQPYIPLWTLYTSLSTKHNPDEHYTLCYLTTIAQINIAHVMLYIALANTIAHLGSTANSVAQ